MRDVGPSSPPCTAAALERRSARELGPRNHAALRAGLEQLLHKHEE